MESQSGSHSHRQAQCKTHKELTRQAAGQQSPGAAGGPRRHMSCRGCGSGNSRGERRGVRVAGEQAPDGGAVLPGQQLHQARQVGGGAGGRAQAGGGRACTARARV